MAYDFYDNFAYFYNKYWTLATPTLMEKALDILFFPYIEKGSRIIDLCCGTGNFANIMDKKEYTVTGVDSSRGMLAYAAINAPNVNFINEDIRDLNINGSFNGVTCLFDSINHILDPMDVVKVFEKAHSLLNDGGLFIFDVNSEEAFIDATERSFNAVDNNDVCVFTASYNKQSRITKYYITTFLLDNNLWQRNDVVIKEKFYTNQEILSMLHMAGFSNVRVTDGFADLEIESFDGRIFFTGWK